MLSATAEAFFTLAVAFFLFLGSEIIQFRGNFALLIFAFHFRANSPQWCTILVLHRQV
jgi:hypothetical protein